MIRCTCLPGADGELILRDVGCVWHGNDAVCLHATGAQLYLTMLANLLGEEEPANAVELQRWADWLEDLPERYPVPVEGL